MIRVLLIEDNPGEAGLVEMHLQETGGAEFVVEHVDRLQDGLERIDAGGIDLVLTDLNLPDSVGLDTFRAIHEHARELPIVILSGYEDEETALAAVRQGAQDYLVKGALKPEYLARAVRYAITRQRQLLVGLVERSEQATPAMRPAANETDDPPPLARAILLIEPRPEDRELVERSLVGGQRLLIHAATGQEGLERARSDRPALILLDLDLPDMAGEEALRTLKADGRTAATPVVVTSAYNSPRRVQELRDAGAAACISKPIDVQHLLQTIAEQESEARP